METRVLRPENKFADAASDPGDSPISSINAIDITVVLLRAGELVAVPTETVYGLAADVRRPEALLKIFEAKERPLSDPLIVHIERPWLDRYVDLSSLPPPQRQDVVRLMDAFWPGPLTLVLPKSPTVHEVITNGMSTVALRAPSHPLLREILQQLGGAIAAPSANRFGRISPTRAEHVLKELGGRIPAILDGGPCTRGLESTILRPVPSGGWELLRSGALSLEALEEVIGPIQQPLTNKQGFPGSQAQHYSPTHRLFVLNHAIESYPDFPRVEVSRALLTQDRATKIGVLLFQEKALPEWLTRSQAQLRIEVLSLGGSAEEAAHQLYSRLRALDEWHPDFILAESPPTQTGLNLAISDRLRRASHAMA